MLRWSMYVVGAIGAVAAVALVVGWSLPVAHRAAQTRAIAAPPDRVFALITDFARYPEWQKGVSRVETSGTLAEGQMIRQFGSTGEIPMRVQTLASPDRLVMRIAGEDLPFGGTWTYDLRANATGGTDVTITEDGEIYNALFRVLARFVFGYTATMTQYLDDLERRFQGGRTSFPQIGG